MNLGSNRLDYQKLLEMSSLSIALVSPEKKIIFANNHFLNTFETSREQTQKMSLTDFFDLNEQHLQKLNSCKINQIAFKENILCHHQNDEYSECYVIAKKVSLPYGNGDGFYFEFFDDKISQKNTPQKTNQSLEKIGKVTSQISHDISNPLAILRIHCDSFNLIAQKQEMISSKDVTKRMDKISNAAVRITDTTNQLKYFSKKLLAGDDNAIQKIWEQSQSIDNNQLPVKD